MPDDTTRDTDWRLGRFEHDISELRGDMKAGFREVNTSVSNLQSAIQGLQVSLPLTYVTRIDLAERIKNAEDQMAMRVVAAEESGKSRDASSQKSIGELQTTIRQLMFAIIGALISGGLALLIEVLKLISGGKT